MGLEAASKKIREENKTQPLTRSKTWFGNLPYLYTESKNADQKAKTAVNKSVRTEVKIETEVKAEAKAKVKVISKGKGPDKKPQAK